VNAFLCVFLPLLIAFEVTLRWCWDLWWTDDGYFAHGPLVPVVMALVFWRRREQWRRRPAALDHRAWWLLGPALFVHLCGAALTIDSLSAVGLALAVPASAWLALGRERLRGQWPTLWMFAFAVPLPIYVTGQVVVRLKEIAIGGGVAIARFVGQMTLSDGAPLVVRGIDGLHIDGQRDVLVVADACSGLRSLLAMVTVAYFVAFFLGPRQRMRLAALLALAAPFALGVNVVRIAVICLLARAFGVGFASGTGHTLANVCAFALNFGLLMGVDWLVTRAGEAPAPLPDPVPALLPAPRPLRRVGVVLWIAALPLLLLSETRPYTASSGRARQLPAVAGAYTLQTTYDFKPQYFQLLGTDDVT
jgi:exosortase